MYLYEYSIATNSADMHNITTNVQQCLHQSGVKNGICVVFCPHTTAAITINENADPDVVNDMLNGLEIAFSQSNKFRHYEGNSPAHLKSSTVGASETIIIENGQLLLGQWQGIYLCEFDGPRNRKFYVKIIQG